VCVDQLEKRSSLRLTKEKRFYSPGTCMATRATNIQLAVSKGSKKAVGEMIPVRLATWQKEGNVDSNLATWQKASNVNGHLATWQKACM